MIRPSLAAAGCVAALALAAPAFAQTQGVAPATTEGSGVAVDDGDRIICRAVRYTGSRFPERVCKTKRERDAEQQAARNSTEKFLERNRRNNVKPDGGAAYNRQNRL